MTAVVVGFWFLSTPFGSWAFAAPLTRAAQRIESREQAAGADVVVVLTGGTDTHLADGFGLDDMRGGALRAIEGARLYRVLGNPTVIVSGGNAGRLDVPRPEAEKYRRAIVELGVPADRVIVEDQSLNTRTQALMVKGILASRNVDRFVLVTSPTHMSRSLAAFRALGMHPVQSASRARSGADESWRTVLPDPQSLRISDSAAYEYTAWIYYRLKGWV